MTGGRYRAVAPACKDGRPAASRSGLTAVLVVTWCFAFPLRVADLSQFFTRPVVRL